LKIECPICGLHFQDEYKKSLKCGFWKAKGYPADFPRRYKYKLWKWFFSLPADEILSKFGLAINLRLDCKKDPSSSWTNMIKEYKDWDDEKRRRFQTDVYRMRKMMQQEPNYFVLAMTLQLPEWKNATINKENFFKGDGDASSKDSD